MIQFRNLLAIKFFVTKRVIGDYAQVSVKADADKVLLQQ